MSTVNMSLDEIIKQQRKQKAGRGRRSMSSSMGGDRRGRRRRGGGGVALTSRGGTRRRAGMNSSVSRIRGGNKLKLRRSLRSNGNQRLAQRLVKRAMLSTRRRAIIAKKDSLQQAGPSSNQRLVAQVRKWRQTARVLSQALKQVTTPSPLRDTRPRRRGVRFLTRVDIDRPIQNRRPTLNTRNVNRGSVLSRLGWTPLATGNLRRSRRTTGRHDASFVSDGLIVSNKGRGPNFGRMQSDEVSREQQRQRRLAADLMALATANQMNRNPSTRGRRRGNFSPNFNSQSRNSTNIGRRFADSNVFTKGRRLNFNRQNDSGFSDSFQNRQVRFGPKQLFRGGRRGGRYNY